jgi:hypothetical protein
MAPSKPARRGFGEGRTASKAKVLSAPQMQTAPVEGSGAMYVYGVIHVDHKVRFGRIGIGLEPAEVYTLVFEDIAAVVSDTKPALAPSRADVIAHQRVNEVVMRDYTVLPMSFGTIFETRADVRELLRSAYKAFRSVLTKMEDKLEFGLKVLWDREQVIRELEREDDGIRQLKGEISAQKGSTYFARMKYGRLVDAAIQARSDRYVQSIFDSLRRVVVASRADRPSGDDTIMSAAFLVERRQQPDFDGMVKQLGARHDELTIAYTGPWPPYSFVNLRLKYPRA